VVIFPVVVAADSASAVVVEPAHCLDLVRAHLTAGVLKPGRSQYNINKQMRAPAMFVLNFSHNSFCVKIITLQRYEIFAFPQRTNI
jgi:hypothetical protein